MVHILTSDFIIAVLLITGFLAGIRLMQSPRTALWGNRLGALCMVMALLFTLMRTELAGDLMPWLFIITGGILGLVLGQRIRMIHMPQMVALLNGFGGAASAFVAGVAIHIFLAGTSVPVTETPGVIRVTAALALAVGPMTFTGSMVAALKLQNLIEQQPVILKAHHFLQRFPAAAGVVLIILSGTGYATPLLYTGIVILFAVYGVIMTLRVGGADMPIIIALLNSFSGIAASVTGLAVGNALLTGAGALVGVAGLVLTRLMCQAMNRSLSSVMGGFVRQATVVTPETDDAPVDNRIPEVLKKAEKVIIVPGYGMAVAQAQQAIKDLAMAFENRGKQVKIALNPIAGRMIGHMNVLLAEVGVDEKLVSWPDTINTEFAKTDLVVVAGACDAVNPVSAQPDTAISGLPVLRADLAKHVIVCNRDNKPGYSGVPNPLYKQQQVIPVWGDVADTIPELTEMVLQLPEQKNGDRSISDSGMEDDGKAMRIREIMVTSRKVIMVPGYGMAVSQAQQAVNELVGIFEKLGKQVKIAVHPVAGRMPGHMHVLLAEAGVDYNKLYDMKDINHEFSQTDLVIVVGACDVINPAAATAKNTPIYGMPVLQVDQARHIIVCNLDSMPGYSGVKNTLYGQKKVITLWGDAAETVPRLAGLLARQEV